MLRVAGPRSCLSSGSAHYSSKCSTLQKDYWNNQYRKYLPRVSLFLVSLRFYESSKSSHREIDWQQSISSRLVSSMKEMIFQNEWENSLASWADSIRCQWNGAIVIERNVIPWLLGHNFNASWIFFHNRRGLHPILSYYAWWCIVYRPGPSLAVWFASGIFRSRELPHSFTFYRM